MSQLSFDVLRYVILPWRTEIIKYEILHIKLDEFLEKLKDNKIRFRYYYENKIDNIDKLKYNLYKRFNPWDKTYSKSYQGYMTNIIKDDIILNIYWYNVFKMIDFCSNNKYKLNREEHMLLCDIPNTRIKIHMTYDVNQIYRNNLYKFQACQRNIRIFKKIFDSLGANKNEYILELEQHILNKIELKYPFTNYVETIECLDPTKTNIIKTINTNIIKSGLFEKVEDEDIIIIIELDKID